MVATSRGEGADVSIPVPSAAALPRSISGPSAPLVPIEVPPRATEQDPQNRAIDAIEEPEIPVFDLRDPQLRSDHPAGVAQELIVIRL